MSEFTFESGVGTLYAEEEPIIVIVIYKCSIRISPK